MHRYSSGRHLTSGDVLQRIGACQEVEQSVEAQDIAILLTGSEQRPTLPMECYVNVSTGQLRDDVVPADKVVQLIESQLSGGDMDPDGLATALTHMKSLIPARFWHESSDDHVAATPANGHP
jgi:hypothetical protein